MPFGFAKYEPPGAGWRELLVRGIVRQWIEFSSTFDDYTHCCGDMVAAGTMLMT